MATRSFWQTTATSDIVYSSLPATADIVVIGGGIMGTSAAYYAARAGLKTLLIDQAALAYGATGRNGGFITQGAADSYLEIKRKYGRDAAQGIWNYTLDNRRLVHALIEEEGFDFDFREPGSISFALNEAEAKSMQANNAAYEADGGATGEYVWLNHAEAEKQIGTQLSEEIEGCAFKPRNALIHSAKLVYGLGKAAQKHGATLSVAKAHGIQQNGANLTVQTWSGNVSARHVIVAGNAWTDELVPSLAGVIVPARGQMLGYEPTTRVFHSGMGASVTPTGEYWQQTLNGTIVIGGCRADAPDREVNLREDALRPEVQTALEKVLPRLFPRLNNLRLAHRWSGPMAFTKDYLPVIDSVPGMQNAWVCGGFNGHGMCYGLITGKTLTDAALAGGKPAALAPFSADRAHLR